MSGCYYSIFTMAMVFVLWQTTLADRNSCEVAKWSNGSFCRTVGYNTTILSDRLGYRSQEDAFRAIFQFAPLVSIGCSADAALFFCSAYLPLCIPPNIAIPPCRSVCLSVKSGCGQIMKKFGYRWPKLLKCSNFPVSGKGWCMAGPGTTTTTTAKTTLVNPTPTKKRTKKRLRRKCKESRNRLNKRCCHKGKKAMKMKLSTCSLVGNITKGLSRKVRRFLRRATKLCSVNNMANECYKSCCQHQKQRQNG